MTTHVDHVILFSFFPQCASVSFLFLCCLSKNHYHLTMNNSPANNEWEQIHCPDCGYQSKNTNDWKRHRNTQHGDKKPFQCQECECRLSSFYALKSHVKAHRKNPGSVVKSFAKFSQTCPDCDFKSQSSVDWKSHRIQVHGDQKPFKCQSCDHKTASFSNIVAHRKFHLNGKPFACHYEGCDFENKEECQVKYHIRVKHLKTTGYKCHICENCSYHRLSLLNHMNFHHRSHDRKKCNQCLEVLGVFNNSFGQKCHVCGRCVFGNSNLMTHMKSRHQNQNHDWRECDQCTGLREFVKRRISKSAEQQDPDATPAAAPESTPDLNDCLIDVHQQMMLL